jgi:hypothetical protein
MTGCELLLLKKKASTAKRSHGSAIFERHTRYTVALLYLVHENFAVDGLFPSLSLSVCQVVAALAAASEPSGGPRVVICVAAAGS